MQNLPLSIGAAIDIAHLPTYRDWLIDGQRDLELQDFQHASLLLGGWQEAVARAQPLLDGFTGRLGIHGPFNNLPLAATDPEISVIVARRMVTAVEAAAALGATQMVVHSPYSTWDWFNFGNNPASATSPPPRSAGSRRWPPIWTRR